MKQWEYGQKFLPGLNFQQALEAQNPRPLLLLYWTLTYFPGRSLKTDDGEQINSLEEASAHANPQLYDFFLHSRSQPLFANIIMGDWIDTSTQHLRVAVASTLRGPNWEPLPTSPDHKAPTDWGPDWYIELSCILALSALILLLVLVLHNYTAKVKQTRARRLDVTELVQQRRRSLAPPPQQMSTMGSPSRRLSMAPPPQALQRPSMVHPCPQRLTQFMQT